MNSDLRAALRFENSIPSRKLLLVTKDEKSDVGFVYADILSFVLKNKFSVVIVNLAQSFNHYNHLLLKTGINLKSHVANGNVKFVNVLNSVEQLLNSDTISDDHYLHCVVSNNEKSDGLKPLYIAIENAVHMLYSGDHTDSEGFVLFIDEINILLNLGIGLKVIQPFIHYCNVLCKKNSKLPGLLLIGKQVESHDPESCHSETYFSHLADMQINVRGLSTGYSRDIHGKVTIEFKDKEQSESETSQFLFKVEEKGVKFSPFGS